MTTHFEFLYAADLPKEPPQLEEAAKEKIIDQALYYGMTRLSHMAMQRMADNEPTFTVFIDAVGARMNRLAPEAEWPEKVLKSGASIALLGYRDSGYYHPIDEEALVKTLHVSDRKNIAAVCNEALIADESLLELNYLLTEAKDLGDSIGGFRQVLFVGSGITRIALQQAMGNH